MGKFQAHTSRKNNNAFTPRHNTTSHVGRWREEKKNIFLTFYSTLDYFRFVTGKMNDYRFIYKIFSSVNNVQYACVFLFKKHIWQGILKCVRAHKIIHVYWNVILHSFMYKHTQTLAQACCMRYTQYTITHARLYMQRRIDFIHCTEYNLMVLDELWLDFNARGMWVWIVFC